MDKGTLRWNKIRKYLKTHDYIMNAYVRKLCGVSAGTANRRLIQLVTDNIINRVTSTVIGNIVFIINFTIPLQINIP